MEERNILQGSSIIVLIAVVLVFVPTGESLLCKKGERFTICGNDHCRPTCKLPYGPKDCNPDCKPGCICVRGLVRRNTGEKCIKRSECPGEDGSGSTSETETTTQDGIFSTGQWMQVWNYTTIYYTITGALGTTTLSPDEAIKGGDSKTAPHLLMKKINFLEYADESDKEKENADYDINNDEEDVEDGQEEDNNVGDNNQEEDNSVGDNNQEEDNDVGKNSQEDDNDVGENSQEEDNDDEEFYVEPRPDCSKSCSHRCITRCECSRYEFECCAPNHCQRLVQSSSRRRKSSKQKEKKIRQECIKKGETFTRCRGLKCCQRICRDAFRVKGSAKCASKCVPGCECPTPKVRNEKNNQCVSIKQCPGRTPAKAHKRGRQALTRKGSKCDENCRKKNARYSTCTGDPKCRPTCSNPKGLPRPGHRCHRKCHRGCICKSPLVKREEDGMCVHVNDCGDERMTPKDPTNERQASISDQQEKCGL